METTNPFKENIIPFPMNSRENMIAIENTLEDDELAEFYHGFHNYVLYGEEPTFMKKVLKGLWLSTKETLDRKATDYLKQTGAGRKNLQQANEKRKKEMECRKEFEKRGYDKRIENNQPVYSDEVNDLIEKYGQEIVENTFGYYFTNNTLPF